MIDRAEIVRYRAARLSDVTVHAERKGPPAMQSFQKLCIATIMLIVLGQYGLTCGAEKSPPPAKKPPPPAPPAVHTIDASMDYPSGPVDSSIRAEKRPGSFTIPKGSVTAKLHYTFFDPKSGYSSTRIHGGNIYSVAEHRYMKELDKDPNFPLPPGEYKFVVGGEPGAAGRISYTLMPAPGVKFPPGDSKRDPHTRMPPPTDTSKSGTEREPLHPGGEGKRKVKVHVDATITDSRGVTHGNGDLSATLTVSEGAIRLEFDTNPGEHPNKTDRWEGTLTRQGQVLTVKGSTLTYYPPVVAGAMSSTWRGTFEGRLEGTVLKGTMAAHNGDVHADMEAEWSIKDFAR